MSSEDYGHALNQSDEISYKRNLETSEREDPLLQNLWKHSKVWGHPKHNMKNFLCKYNIMRSSKKIFKV